MPKLAPDQWAVVVVALVVVAIYAAAAWLIL
jgi:hypothetical protein